MSVHVCTWFINSLCTQRFTNESESAPKLRRSQGWHRWLASRSAPKLLETQPAMCAGPPTRADLVEGMVPGDHREAQGLDAVRGLLPSPATLSFFVFLVAKPSSRGFRHPEPGRSISKFTDLNGIFFFGIHFELARLAAGTTVDTLHAPIDDFRRF